MIVFVQLRMTVRGSIISYEVNDEHLRTKSNTSDNIILATKPSFVDLFMSRKKNLSPLPESGEEMPVKNITFNSLESCTTYVNRPIH